MIQKMNMITLLAAASLGGLVFFAGPLSADTKNRETHHYRFTLQDNVYGMQDESFENPVQIFKNWHSKVSVAKGYSLLTWQKIDSPPPKPKQAYHRQSHFGSWKSSENPATCLDTRNTVLARESLEPVSFSADYKCRIEKGLWFDPTTDQYFERSSDLQVDHFVPLKHAYETGAFQWKRSRRCHYTNFLKLEEHLLPIDRFENLRKGSRSPEKYLPQTEFKCEYLARWLKLKLSWNLIITPQEAEAIRLEIENQNCPMNLFRFTRKDLQRWILSTEDTPSSCLKEDTLQRD